MALRTQWVPVRALEKVWRGPRGNRYARCNSSALGTGSDGVPHTVVSDETDGRVARSRDCQGAITRSREESDEADGKRNDNGRNR